MQKGRLYIVSTPIGNLKDITFRAVEILKSVDLIASEDTRHTKKLLSHYDIHTRLTSYHEHNEKTKSEKIVDELKRGRNVALVTNAGTPCISDPGYRLTSKAGDEGIELIPVPGPSAAITALSVSGLPTDRFLFVGFLPDKKGKRLKKLEELKDETATMIFYISKWKVEKTLSDMIEVFGDRKVCYCRELTKIHEEICHLNLSELLESIKTKPIKGEITLIVSTSSSSLSP